MRKYRINEEIKAKEVRVVDKEGKQIGIMSIEEALDKAYEQDLDLIEVAPKETPPVCKIMNYDKFRYQQEKREKQEHKRLKKDILKEIWVRPTINNHDYKVKLKHIEEFIKSGEKVRIRIKFKGREVTHLELFEKLINRLKEDTKEYTKSIEELKKEGMLIGLTLIPK